MFKLYKFHEFQIKTNQPHHDVENGSCIVTRKQKLSPLTVTIRIIQWQNFLGERQTSEVWFDLPLSY